MSGLSCGETGRPTLLRVRVPKVLSSRSRQSFKQVNRPTSRCLRFMFPAGRAVTRSPQRLTFTLSLTLFASACATTPRPAVEVRIQRVEIPVVQKCIDAKDIPAVPPKVRSDLNGNAGHDLAIITASALRLRAALMEAAGLLDGCAR